MKIIIFGLTMSSSWGNGHATIWRGLCAAMARRGHAIIFYERDVPYYAAHRDQENPEGVDLRLYDTWEKAVATALSEIPGTEAAIVTSYCPDGISAAELVLEHCRGLKVFYDLDSPVTLERLAKGESLSYIGNGGLAGFDLVMSYTGGIALDELRRKLGAKRTVPLYGSVDPRVHQPVPVPEVCRADLSYLGTYADDRQEALRSLFIDPARKLPDKSFLIGGSLYPPDFPWTRNMFYLRHVAPPDHSHFYCSSRLTLNVTRGAMASMGYCPSGRLFEAASCGIPILSDYWDGMDKFFTPGSEILIASDTAQAIETLSMPVRELETIGRAARERALRDHTAEVRAAEMETILETTRG